jgi:hypothetical protein
MNASIHPMVFQKTYREVFTQKWLAPDEPILPSVHLTLKKDQMLGIFSESRREFHKLSNNYKVEGPIRRPERGGVNGSR